MATLSRGYDSPACAALARDCGCERALTISDASWGNPIDSGREIGELLFDEVIERRRQDYFRNAGMPEDVKTVLFNMDFVWSSSNKERIVKQWQAEIER